MKWDYKQIRKYSWDTVFGKGKKPWAWLVAICFLFTLIGSVQSFQTVGLDFFDKWMGGSDEMLPGNIDYLKQYIVNSKLVQNIPFLGTELALTLMDALTRNVTWLIRILAINGGYFERNPGEVIANLILVAALTSIVRFFFQNVVVLGRARYVLENRQQETVRMRRIFAPFHLETLPNVIWVMFRYNATLVFWYALLFIPGVIRSYQYYMVPFILAENPSIHWRQAKKLSCAMTKGYKWKMFVTTLSYFYIWILDLIPFAGILVSTPLSAQLNAEYYFTLRNRSGIDTSLLTEKAFADAPYIKKLRQHKRHPNTQIVTPHYELEDINTKTAHKKGLFRFDYSPTDMLFLFFSFCIIGWIWEVSYKFVSEHVLANRGTMYGPWIPIYGFGGLAIVLLLNRFKESKIKLFALTMIICAILEYLASFALEFIFNSSYWDYHDMFMNVNGRICLAGLLAFGIGGLFGVYIAAPAISRIAGRFQKRTQYIVAAIFCVLFIADIICCILFGFNTGDSVGGKIA